jgi:hypothetical protein
MGECKPKVVDSIGETNMTHSVVSDFGECEEEED